MEKEWQSPSSSLVTLMEKLSFGRLGAEIYSCLLQDGPLSAVELAGRSRTHLPDVQKSIKLLIKLHLVSRDGRRYYTLDPTLGWLAIEADLVWSKRVALGPLQDLPNTNDGNIESLRFICSQVGQAAAQLYRPYSAALAHRERDAETAEELGQLTGEIIYQARGEVVAVSRSPRTLPLALFWAVLTDRIEKKGIKYRRVADLDEIMAHGLVIKRRDMDRYGIDLKVLEQRDVRHEFYLIDARFLAVKHQKGELEAGRRGVGRVTNSDLIIKRYRERFWKYHRRAIPGEVAIEMLQTAGAALLDEAAKVLRPIEVAWLESIVQFGKFSRFHEDECWSEGRRADVERRVALAGFVYRNPYGELVPQYGVSEESVRVRYGSSGE